MIEKRSLFSNFALQLQKRMKPQYIKFGIIGLLFAFAVYQFYLINIGWGILLLLLAGLVVVTLFWHQNHIVALIMMKRNKMVTAEKAVRGVKNPENLPKHQEAYHYFMLGNVESFKRNITKAESFYRKALNRGLKSKTNQAIAKLNLAAACLTRRRKQEAQIYIRDVKKLDKYGMLSDQVKMIEQQMKKI